MSEPTHPLFINTWCPGCDQEGVLFAREEGTRMVTSCKNCGIIATSAYRPNPIVNHKAKLLDPLSCRALAKS